MRPLMIAPNWLKKSICMVNSPTIFALSTAPGVGALAISRLSGTLSLAALQQLSGKKDFAPRYATRVFLTDHGAPLDDGIALYFPAPHSFTGEDCVEITLHGGRATTMGMLTALSNITGLRLAEPGEFTRRAFENDKLDLTQAEAIADLNHAETTLQRTQALAQLSGQLRDLYHGWAVRLTTLLAHAEADIDFPDEDLPAGILAAQQHDIQSLATALQNHLSDNRRGERLRDGITIAILGAPNAGKSTLLNALAQRDVAIVTDIAGTTRDVLEVHLDLGGYPVILLDTAGLRETDDTIERIGIRRARERAEQADLKLCLFDSTNLLEDASASPDEATKHMIDGNTIVVLTKCDKADAQKLCLEIDHACIGHEFSQAGQPLLISARTGSGIETLLTAIQNRLANIFHAARDAPTLTRARHRGALEESLAALERAMAAELPELRAEDLRLSLRALGRITGRVDVEDLLDKIFRDFCIGK